MKLTHLVLSAAALGIFSFSGLSASADEVSDRLQNQQNRINQGVQSGALTGKEQQNLQNRENHLENTVAKEKAANGGELTKGEEKRLNHKLNRESRRIHRKKHN